MIIKNRLAPSRVEWICDLDSFHFPFSKYFHYSFKTIYCNFGEGHKVPALLYSNVSEHQSLSLILT